MVMSLNINGSLINEMDVRCRLHYSGTLEGYSCAVFLDVLPLRSLLLAEVFKGDINTSYISLNMSATEGFSNSSTV